MDDIEIFRVPFHFLNEVFAVRKVHVDYNNNVIETSAANIFAIKNNKVFSPRLDECGIKGVFLQSLCDKLAVEFKTVSVDDLTQADAVFLCNSLMKIVPVVTFKDVSNQIFKGFDRTCQLKGDGTGERKNAYSVWPVSRGVLVFRKF